MNWAHSLGKMAMGEEVVASGTSNAQPSGVRAWAAVGTAPGGLAVFESLTPHRQCGQATAPMQLECLQRLADGRHSLELGTASKISVLQPLVCAAKCRETVAELRDQPCQAWAVCFQSRQQAGFRHVELLECRAAAQHGRHR